MKQIFGILATLLLLTGCGGAALGPDYREAIRQTAAQPYSFGGTLTLEQLEQPIQLQGQKGCDGLTLTLQAPPELAKLTLHFGEGTVRVEYRELMMQLVEGDIPESSIFVALSRVLPVLGEGEATQQDGRVLLTGAADSIDFKAMWQGETARLLWLELPSVGAKIVMDDFLSGG